MLAKIGPLDGTRSRRVWRLKTAAPVMSVGSRSGVHWIRLKSASIERASAFAKHRLADPGHVLDRGRAPGRAGRPRAGPPRGRCPCRPTRSTHATCSGSPAWIVEYTSRAPEEDPRSRLPPGSRILLTRTDRESTLWRGSAPGGRMADLDDSGAQSDAEGGRIVAELPCRDCRYTLIGRAITDRCPECGLPVEASLHASIDLETIDGSALASPRLVSTAVGTLAIAALIWALGSTAAWWSPRPPRSESPIRCLGTRRGSSA